MNVQDAARKALEHLGRDLPQVSGQEDDLDVVLLEQLEGLSAQISRLTILGRNHRSGHARGLSTLQSSGTVVIADEQRQRPGGSRTLVVDQRL